MKSFIEIASGLCPLQRQTASDCHEPIPSALAMTKRGSHCEERDSFVCHCEERDSFVCHCEECNDEAISLLMKILSVLNVTCCVVLLLPQFYSIITYSGC